jgi:uncharacterized protein with HEPN domain
MHKDLLVREILGQMLEAIAKIERRFAGIGNGNDFTSSDEGIDRLDGICMMLMAIGESCKNLDKITDGVLLPKYPAVDWKGVKGIRDVISHQYFDLDADSVFGVCKNHVPLLRSTIEVEET